VNNSVFVFYVNAKIDLGLLDFSCKCRRMLDRLIYLFIFEIAMIHDYISIFIRQKGRKTARQ